MRQQETARWRGGPVEAETGEGMRRYVDAVRDHWRIVAGVFLVTLAAAALYLATAPKVYRAQAQLLITPAPPDDPTALFTPGVIRSTSDPVQGAQTAASVALSSSVAARARALLHNQPGAASAVGSATAAPIGESNVLAITAQSDHPTLARDAANAVAQATVAERTAQLHQEVDRAIPALQRQLDDAKAVSPAPGSLEDTLSRLQAMRAGPDPTVSVESLAVVPSSAASPRRSLTVLAAVLVGLVLGLGTALGMRALDPRLRREEQLPTLGTAAPVLARIPANRLGGPLRRVIRRAPDVRPALDPYRALVASLAASLLDRPGARTVVLSGSSRGDGVTTTAMQLARAIAAGGNRVILVSTDPTLEASSPTGRGLSSVLVGATSVSDALVPAAGSQNLRLLLARDDYAGEWEHEGISHRAARDVLQALKTEADWVIVDAPPLNGMVNALPFAQEADALVLVTRVGKTKLPDVAEVLDIVQRHELPMTGYALVGARVRRVAERSSRPIDELEAALDSPIRAA
jgi:Mrp family chromosome partitioning ATPase